jgi:hypothetical protein
MMSKRTIHSIHFFTSLQKMAFPSLVLVILHVVSACFLVIAASGPLYSFNAYNAKKAKYVGLSEFMKTFLELLPPSNYYKDGYRIIYDVDNDDKDIADAAEKQYKEDHRWQLLLFNPGLHYPRGGLSDTEYGACVTNPSKDCHPRSRILDDEGNWESDPDFGEKWFGGWGWEGEDYQNVFFAMRLSWLMIGIWAILFAVWDIVMIVVRLAKMNLIAKFDSVPIFRGLGIMAIGWVVLGSSAALGFAGGLLSLIIGLIWVVMGIILGVTGSE